MFNAQRALARSLVLLAFLINWACAQTKVAADPAPGTFNPDLTNAGQLTRRQAAIWIPIIFVVFTAGAVMALVALVAAPASYRGGGGSRETRREPLRAPRNAQLRRRASCLWPTCNKPAPLHLELVALAHAEVVAP